MKQISLGLLMQGPSGWGWQRSTSAGLITALGLWEPPRGKSNGQPFLLVRRRSSTKGCWVEAH